MKDTCIFCKIIREEIPTKKIYENENFLSIPDANPRVEGHSLVISKKHFENILDMPTSLGQELIDCIKKTSLKLMDEKKAKGFNVINNNFKVAGQIVKHVHFHIIPRKKDDGEIKFINKS
ncbi:MAG: HIT domain-containing protein [Candidatus Pacearchaeota archaeon]|jgi:histidine triad (HIT) family protein|nr:HIT family protein [Candidatus Pacearchaeota archaeon]MDP7520938.1 HIT domain-containing protein [Candidatus Pacearchaeota archaeon]|tara:strand:- start:1813 stop:2172 length:360 start_codon:yes stop_codon:yes gene_type:complete